MYSLWSTVQTGSVRLGTKEHTESHAASMLAADIACTTLKAHSLRLLAGQARVVVVHRWLLSVQHHGHQQTFSEGSTKKCQRTCDCEDLQDLAEIDMPRQLWPEMMEAATSVLSPATLHLFKGRGSPRPDTRSKAAKTMLEHGPSNSTAGDVECMSASNL